MQRSEARNCWLLVQVVGPPTQHRCVAQPVMITVLSTKLSISRAGRLTDEQMARAACSLGQAGNDVRTAEMFSGVDALTTTGGNLSKECVIDNTDRDSTHIICLLLSTVWSSCASRRLRGIVTRTQLVRELRGYWGRPVRNFLNTRCYTEHKVKR